MVGYCGDWDGLLGLTDVGEEVMTADEDIIIAGDGRGEIASV